MQLTVLTLNLWNISEPLAPRMAALEARLKTLRPEIVCLQEVAVVFNDAKALASDHYGVFSVFDLP